VDEEEEEVPEDTGEDQAKPRDPVEKTPGGCASATPRSGLACLPIAVTLLLIRRRRTA
jgi:hypothetical protein